MQITRRTPIIYSITFYQFFLRYTIFSACIMGTFPNSKPSFTHEIAKFKDHQYVYLILFRFRIKYASYFKTTASSREVSKQKIGTFVASKQKISHCRMNISNKTVHLRPKVTKAILFSKDF